MWNIVLVNDRTGNVDSYAAGDPTPGRGANEFSTRESALEAIASLEEPDEEERWEVRGCNEPQEGGFPGHDEDA